jgi:hypothetical protein
VSGSIAFSARVVGRSPRVRKVVFAVDGRPRWTDRARPYRYRLDTRTLRNGIHELRAEVVYANRRVGISRKQIRVLNTSISATSGQPTSSTNSNATTTTAPTGPTTGTGTGSSGVLWSGDFETSSLSQWPVLQACTGGVSIVTSPVRGGGYAAKFTVTDQSTDVNCPAVPTSSPRAQLVSPAMFTPGADVYIGFSTFFPADFPTISDGWMQVAEVYGPPFGGSPPIGVDVVGNRLVLSRDATHNWDKVWTSATDIAKGTGWEDIVLHVKFSTDPRVGFVELWRNGRRQTFTNGSQTLFYNTIVPIVNGGGPNALYLNQYRSSTPALGTVTLYHDQAKVGSSYASVAPV